MKKKIETQNITKKVNNALSDVENKVPRTIKETYTFKGRKAPEILAKVISSLTDKNAYILDPFLGSGMTLIASQKANRKFLGIELDNYTYSIDKTLFEKVDSEKLEEYFQKIRDKVKENVMYLYETEYNGEKNYIKKILFDRKNGKEGYFNPQNNREIKNKRNVILVKKASDGNRRKKFDEIDWNKIQEVDKIDESPFPKDTYFENSRINITKSTGADKYGEIFVQPEYEHSKYSFEVSDQDLLLGNFDRFEKEAKRCIDERLVHPAYDYILKCSHTFNLLDARGAVSVTERAGYLARIRNMARQVAKLFVAERENLGYPLLDPEVAQKLIEEGK